MLYEVTGKLIINPKSRDWCTMPYPGNPNGCPNFGKQPTCPPLAPLIGNFIDLSRPHWLDVYCVNLKEEADKRRKQHPDWSEKKLRCSRYWQNTAHAYLRRSFELMRWTEGWKGVVMTLRPEAMGVNVIQTAKRVGVPISIHPKDLIFKISLIGFKKTGVVI